MAKGKRRTFSPQFKAQVVLEVLTGQKTQAEVCRLYQLSPTLLGLWKTTVLERLERIFDCDEARSHEQARIAELEQLAGRQALEIEILKKASRRWTGAGPSNGRLS